MRFIYNIGIRLYWTSAWIISLWNQKAKLWLRGRKGWYGKMRAVIGKSDRVIWFHCASLGEFEQGRPVIEAIRNRFPGHRIVLTFFSPSGYEKRKNYKAADHVMYLPLDTARNARLLVNYLFPEIVIFIKYEFWYHFLNHLKNQGIPLFLVSGVFRPDQLFFKWYGKWYRKFLDCFTHIFVQQDNSSLLLRQFGLTRVTVAGDTRFDRVRAVAETEYKNSYLENFSGGSRVILAGSTWEKDEEIIYQAYRELTEDIRWIIAPHELSRTHIERLSKWFPSSVLFTELEHEIPVGTRVVIIDSIGQLSYLYRYGALAYIGGGFGKGIHNILEAATYGLPVIFGPAYTKFSEAVDLAAMGGAFPVQDERELLFTIHQQFENPELLKTSSQIAANYVKDKLGATSKILEEVCKKTGVNML